MTNTWLRIDHAGTVTFLYPAHGIETSCAQARLAIEAAGSSAVINLLLDEQEQHLGRKSTQRHR